MKIDTISLFSGGGGLDLGFKNSGFNIVYAIDIDFANKEIKNVRLKGKKDEIEAVAAHELTHIIN